ncbi:MAG: glycosyltransferase [Lachnospiraceae bacterium]|nr:glycosyltransferase [Lachnospiraceae bacterium]
MKRIILFKGNGICYNTLNIFADIVSGELSKLGIESGFVDLSLPADELGDNFEDEVKKGCDAFLGFNIGDVLFGCENLFNYLKKPVFDWIVDHPCEHAPVIQNNINDFNVICLDRDHKIFIEKYLEGINKVAFIPLGGYYAPETVAGQSELPFGRDQFESRRYDISFTASHIPLPGIMNKIDSLPDRMRKISLTIIDYLKQNRDSTNEEALIYALNEVIGTKDVGNEIIRKIGFYTKTALFYMRQYVREEFVKNLIKSGVEAHLFGVGWEELEGEGLGNIIIHAPISYEETSHIAYDSRISINILPWFKNGLHDRIPTSMLKGSAVFTDTNKYINEDFSLAEDRELITFDMKDPESAPAILEAFAKDRDKLYDIAVRGRKKAKERFGWNSRVREFLSLL